MVVLLLGGWLGAHLPITDLGYLDLAQGRSVSVLGQLELPPVQLDSDATQPTAAWAGGWLLFKTYDIGGETGLRFLAASLSAIGALLLFLICPNSSGWLMTMAATSIAIPYMDISTYLYGWPLTAGFLCILQAIRRRSSGWALVFPLLLTAWALLSHEVAVGAFLVGLAFLEKSVSWISDYRHGKRGKPTLKADVLPLVGALTLSFAVVFLIMPESATDVTSPVSTGLLMRETPVSEWVPVSLENTPIFLVFAAATGLFVGLRRLIDVLAEVIALAVFVVLSLVTGHFIIYFAAVATPSAARSLNEWVGQISAVRPRWLRLLAHPILFLVLGIVAVAPKLLKPRDRHAFESAVNVVNEEKLRGPFFNVPETGGLLGWVAGPDQTPFSDLRPSSLALFQQASRDGRLPVDSEREEARLAILSWDFLPLLRDKMQSEENDLWLVYLDDSALIYASPKSNSRVVENLAFRHFDPMMDPRDYTEEIVPSISRELFTYFHRYPMSARALVKLGPLLLREGRNEEALEVFEAARLLQPDNPFIWKNLSELYLYKGMYGLAEQASRQGLEIVRDHDFLLYLANALYGQGQFEEAVEWFEEVLRLNPDDVSALRAMVDIHQRLERTERASQHRQRLQELESSELKVLLEEAETKKAQLDFSGAALAYQEAHDIVPADEGILWNLAVALLTDSRNEEAALVLKEIVRQRPKHALAHLTLGALCADKVQCEPEEARLHLETFLMLSPTDINADLARSELARLPRGKR